MMHTSAINVPSDDFTGCIYTGSEGKDRAGKIDSCISWKACVSARCESKRGQRHASKANPEFLQHRTARDGTGHSFSELIDFVVHSFPFASVIRVPFAQRHQLPAIIVVADFVATGYRPKKRKTLQDFVNGECDFDHCLVRRDWLSLALGANSDSAAGILASALLDSISYG
jgi:hypothetical protein